MNALENKVAIVTGGGSGIGDAAVCVPLGNYHNCGARNKIAAEFVSLADACAMVDLLADAARRMPDYARLTGRLPARLRLLLGSLRRPPAFCRCRPRQPTGLLPSARPAPRHRLLHRRQLAGASCSVGGRSGRDGAQSGPPGR